MKRKLASITAAALTSTLLLTSCSQGESTAGEGDEITMWVIGADTPPEARDYLVETFAEETGATLTIEEQTWGDIITKLTAALPDAENTPDVTEIGNTQSATFSSVGAFMDISDMYEELGGDDLLPSFVETGMYDGANYTLPYYFGSRYVFYRKDIWQAAGVSEPTTLDDFNAAVTSIAEKNPKDIDNFSGFFLGGQDWRDGISWIFANGGEIATQDDAGTWTAALDSPEALRGLEQLQEIYRTASRAPNDAKDANQYQYLNDSDQVTDEEGNVTGDLSLSAATIMAPGWANGSIGDLSEDENGDPIRQWNDETFGTLVLPGTDGEPAPVFAGGSNIGISAKTKNPELSRELLRIVYSEEYQNILGENGLGPANQTYTDSLGDDQFAHALIESASNSKLTPASPGWSAVESQGIMEEFFSQIRDSEDLEQLAKETNAKLDPLLNQQ